MNWLMFSKDLTALLAVSCAFLLSGVGFQFLFSKMGRRSINLWEAASVGNIALLGITLILGLSTWPIVGGMAVVSLAVQVLGLVLALWRWPSYWASIRRAFKEYWPVFLFVPIMYVYWIWVQADLAGLPTHHDGMGHTALFLRLMDSGRAFVHMTPQAFAAEFGLDYLQFYPCGSHIFTILMTGWLSFFGLIQTALLLKGWMLFACATSSLFAFTVSRYCYPSASKWQHLLVAFAAATFFQFPVWGTDSGGFSRILAQWLFLPVLFAVLRRGLSAKPQGLEALFLVLFFPAIFVSHPSVFGLSLMVFSCVFCCRLWRGRKTAGAWLRDGLWILLPSVLAVGVILYILSTSQSFDVIDQGSLRQRNLAFTWPVFAAHIWDFVINIFIDGNRPSYLFISTRELLRLLAVLGLMLPLVAGALPGATRVFTLWAFVCGVLFSACAFAQNRFLTLLGELFYNHVGRLLEVYFLLQCLLWSVGLATGLFLVKTLTRRINHPHHARKYAMWTANAVIGLYALLFTFDTWQLGKFNKRHLAKYFVHYSSPLRSDTEEMVKYIRRNTEADAVILYRPFVADSIEARTGRQGLFMYAECPTSDYKTPNCEKRHALLNQVQREVVDRAKQPTPDVDCLQVTEVFHRPVYVVQTLRDLPEDITARGEAPVLCRNMQVVAFRNDFAILAVKR